MPNIKEQIFIAVFFLLWGTNLIYCHYITRLHVETRQEVIRLQEAGFEPENDQDVRRRFSRTATLLFVNVPLMIGIMVNADTIDPTQGAMYWVLLVLGSLYIPIFLSFLIFFLLHPPHQRGAFPGEEIDDGSLEDEDDDD